MAFISSRGENLKDLYLSEYELIDRYIGDRLWQWGEGSALGIFPRPDQSSPIQTISGGTNWRFNSSGNVNTGAIKTDGTLWVWGRNFCSGLGVNSTLGPAIDSPTQTVAGGSNWKQVSIGNDGSAAIKTDGTLWLWGNNAYGQLGINSTILTLTSSAVQTISGGTNWKQVSAESDIFAATKSDGTLWLWGRNICGQLGDGSTINKSSPVQTISGGTNWKQVSNGGSHVAAIKSDGTLWLWGSNLRGQLGTLSTIYTSSPVQTISGNTNWRQVAARGPHVAAIKNDGTLWLWGQGGGGALGNNSTTNRSSPVQTSCGGNNWKQVSVGSGLTSAVKTDGTLWTWGCNIYGQLGNNSSTNRSTPVQTVANRTYWMCSEAGSGGVNISAISISDL